MTKITTIVLATIVIVLGVLVSIFQVNNYIYHNQVDTLLTQANQAALFVNAADVLGFSKSAEDLNNEKYVSMLQKLTEFRSMNSQIRFLYLLGYDKDIHKQFFFLDTEPDTSADYSPPGQLFEDTRQIDIDNYLKGESYVDGPYEDSWGKWYSAYAPIKDASGNVVALVGIDVSVSLWRSQMIFSDFAISLVGALVLAVILFLIFKLYNKDYSITTLEKKVGFFANKENHLKEIEKLFHAGHFSLYFPEKLFSFDDELSSLFKIREGENVSLADFLSMIHSDDRKAISSFVNTIAYNKTEEIGTNFRLINNTGSFDQYSILGNVSSSETNPERFVFVGVMQRVSK